MSSQPYETSALTLADARVRYHAAEIGLQHLGHDGGGAMACRPSADDAYVAIIQMAPLPTHDYWLNGRHHRQAGGSSQAIGIFHLGDAPTCRIAEANDNLHLHIPRAALDALADDVGAAPIERLATEGWETHDGVIEGLKHAITSSFAHRCQGTNLFLDHAVLALHTHIARRYGGLRLRDRHTGGLAPWQTRAAQEMLAEHLSRELALADVAAACDLSLSHFTRAFKASTGTTPHAFRQARRIERAKTLLLEGEMSLAEIALQCGFADQSHFTRVFSASSGIAPGAWRRLRAA
jgi:AraC family transcriptional regulator